ncbi:MAG: 23S rRNA (guanosine(2251)-2'-O)-methyltransferase RlmB [Desulfobacterales bacterium]|nr:23S rRNA (guanosine(2251)-2'-O)-methyltransferase RlmB [Desulfobacterales bacterium]
MEILYGIHPVTEALKAGRRDFVEIYLAGEKSSGRVLQTAAMAESKGIPVKKKTAAQLGAITRSEMHQGIGAGVGPYPLVEMDTILNKSAERGGRPFILLLDTILDPHNFGALVRTADSVGIDGIIMPKDRSAPPSPAVSKASSGALEHVLLARVTNMVNAIKDLKRQGVWIVGMDRDADQSLFSSDLTDSIAIIIGGEEKGIRPLVKQNCDFRVSIPQAGQVASLNASVAGAVVMYEAYRQRTLCKSEARNPKQ